MSNVDFSKIKAEKWADYRNLLARSVNEPLSDGDRANLFAIMGMLSISESELANDIQAISDISRLEATVADAERVEKQLDKVRDELNAFNAETARINAERHVMLAKLIEQENRSVGERSRLQDAWSQLPQLKKSHPRLFGDTPRPTPTKVEPQRDVRLVVPRGDLGIKLATRDERMQLLDILAARKEL